jgi:signal transduction histidine kinase
MKPYSLTQRLITTLLLVEFLAALLLTSAAMLYDRHERFHAFDIMLRGRADSLLGAVQDAEDKEDNVMLDGTEANFPADDLYQVQDANGRVLGHSPNWNGPTTALRAAGNGEILRLSLQHTHYRALKIEGLRIVDPGDKGGGIPRRVTIFYGSPTDGVWHDIWRTVSFYALTSLSLLAISGLCIFWLLHRGLAPLRDLATAASRVSVDRWNFTPPPEARQVKELAPLTLALETVLQGLEQSFLKQRRFVGDAAHELKTAVAVLKSSLQRITLKPRTVQEYAQGIERCQTDCDRMEEAVAKMLTLARLESPPETPALREAADLAAALLQVSQQFESMAELKRLRLLVSAPAPVLVDGEPDQLQLLCANLLLNALQHTPPGAAIRAIAQSDENGASLVMEDDGDGIAAEDLPHVFDRFYRGDPARSRETGGTGLGLSICKAIATRANAAIEITSHPGAGTRVVVRFPAARLPSGDLKVAMRQ